VACAELLDFLRVAAVRPEPPAAAGENPTLIRGATLCPVQLPDAAALVAQGVAGGAAPVALPLVTFCPSDAGIFASC
jgi:hypothetical protein